MKVKYIYESGGGLFKTPEQAKKKKEEENKKSSVQKMADTVKNVIKPMIDNICASKDFQVKALVALNALFAAALRKNTATYQVRTDITRGVKTKNPGTEPACGSNSIYTTMKENNPYNDHGRPGWGSSYDIDVHPFYVPVIEKKAFDDAERDVTSKVKTLKDVFWKDEANVKKNLLDMVSSWGLEITNNDVCQKISSDKRGVLLSFLDNPYTTFFYSNNITKSLAWNDPVFPDDLFVPGEGFKIKMYMMFTGRDFDDKGIERYKELIGYYVAQSLNYYPVEKYYQDIYQETVGKYVAGIKQDLQTIKESAEEYLVSLVDSMLPNMQGLSKDLIKGYTNNLNVSFELVFCRPAIGCAPAGTDKIFGDGPKGGKEVLKGVIPLKINPIIVK